MLEYFVTICHAVLTHVYTEPSDTPKKLMVTALVHKYYTEVNETSIDRTTNAEQKIRNIYLYHPKLSV